MSVLPSIPTAHSVADYIEDGARIAAILLVWGTLGAFFTYGVSEVGGRGRLFETLGPQIGALLVLTGILNALLYLVYRGIDYQHQHD